VSLFLLVLIVTEPNREVFSYSRPVETYGRMVEAPIDIDPACRSFFIKGASGKYTSRSPHMWTLYAIDAMFISLRYGLPTLNGYSAWYPEGWNLLNPQETEYTNDVRQWIERHELRRVCELDIEARTMTLFDD
jgi:hypothetical protein